ncbi:MAG: hypothetical protein KUG82_11155 [Pseudomonadales bacterium]|nr:hypothetical protein [Pseudomonadales bacterium]
MSEFQFKLAKQKLVAIVHPKISFLVLIFSLLFASIYILNILPFQIDDSYITYRYARNLIDGFGFVYNPQGAVVEGFSSPLWLLLLAGFGVLFGSHNILIISVVLGVSVFMLTIWRISETVQRYATSQWALGVVVMAALLPSFVYYAATGMEQMLYIFLLVLCTEAFLKSPTYNLSYQSYLFFLFFLTAWMRPETPFFMVVGAVQCWLVERNIFLGIKRFFPMACYFVFGFCLLLLVRWMVFSDILPNTYYAKEPVISLGFEYVYRALSESHFFILLVMFALAGGYIGTAFHRQMLLSGFLWFIPPVLEGGDWMSSYRFLMPAMTFFILAASGISYFVSASFLQVKYKSQVKELPEDENTGKNEGNPGKSRERKTEHKLAITLILSLTFGVFVGICHKENHYLARVATSTAFTINYENDYRIQFVKDVGARSVGMVDIGKLGYLTDANVYDMAGLTDRVIGLSPGHHTSKQYDLGYFFKRKPQIVFLRAFEIPNADNGFRFGMVETEQLIMESALFHAQYQLLFVTTPAYARKNFDAVLVFKHKEFSIDRDLIDDLPIEQKNDLPMLYFKFNAS